MSVARQQTTTTRGPSDTASVPRLVPAKAVISTRPAVPLGVILLALVALLVAGWGAAAPFAGPDFGFVADRFTAWQWSVTSACLGLGPGGLAFLASLVVMLAAMRTSYARRADVWLLGLVVAVCGVWFVIGQYVWPVIYGTHYIVPSPATHFMWKELAFAVGPGVILVLCGAAFMGWATRRQLALVADRYPLSAVGTPGTVGSPTGTGVTSGVPGATVRPRAVDPATAGNATTGAPVTGTAVTGTPVTGATDPAGTPVTPATATGMPATAMPPATATATTSAANTGTMAPPPAAEQPSIVERPAAGTVEEPTTAGSVTGTRPTSTTPPA